MFQTIFCSAGLVSYAFMPLVAKADETSLKQSPSSQSSSQSSLRSTSESSTAAAAVAHSQQPGKEQAATNTAKLDKWEASRVQALAAANKHHYGQAESSLQQLVKQAGESKANSQRLVVALKDLASVYANDKKFGDARVAYQRVLKIDEQKYGRESSMLITPLNDVIKVTCVTGKCYDTIPELKRLLLIRRKAHGAHSREVPITLLLLGEAYEKHGDFAHAVNYFTEAVATEKKISGEHSGMAAALAKNTERAEMELNLDRQLSNNKKAPAKTQSVNLPQADVPSSKTSKFREGLIVE